MLHRKILCPDREFFCHVFVFNEFLIDCEGKPRFQYHSKIPEPQKVPHNGKVSTHLPLKMGQRSSLKGHQSSFIIMINSPVLHVCKKKATSILSRSFFAQNSKPDGMECVWFPHQTGVNYILTLDCRPVVM